MMRILYVFRKDLRHLWPHVAAVLVLMGLAAWLDPTFAGTQSSAYDLLVGLALPAACWSLIIAAIHEEKLPGDRQYWLTRPFHWQELLASKVLFVAAFVNVPLLLWHVCALRAAGVPLGEHLPALFWRQVFFTAFYILPVAGLAAISRNLGQTIVASLWAIGPVFLLAGMLPPIFPLNGIAALESPAVAAVIAMGVGAMLAMQYRRRATRFSRIAAVATMLLVVAALAASGKWARATIADRSQIRLTIDSSPGRKSTISPNGRPNFVTYDVPVRVEGIPAGADVVPNVVTLEGGGNRRSPSGFSGVFHDLADGSGWLTMERGVVAGSRTASPAGLRVHGRFLVFADRRTFPIPRGNRVAVPRVGVCSDARDSQGMIIVVCYTPDPRAAVMIGASQLRLNWIIPQGMVDRGIPTASGFQPLTRFTSLLGYRKWEDIGDSQLVTAEPLGRMEGNLEIPAGGLSGYLVQR